MGTLGRAREIVDLLEAQGVRATLDPALASPPCILVVPPNLTFDLNCGVTGKWQLVAIAPATNTADRATYEILDDLLDGAAESLPLETGDLVAYSLSGKTYPAYLISFTEAI